MIQRTVDSKLCPICNTEKLSEEYSSDLSRIDGLKFCCRQCAKNYTPKRSKISFDGEARTCVSCFRELPARAFTYSQYNEGKLSLKCRSCGQRKGKAATTEEVIEFETTMTNICSTAILSLINKYDAPHELVIDKYRGELEELVYKAMLRQGLLKKWKTPIWLNKRSIPY